MIATGFSQSTGSIRGTVKNQATGKLLYNASVTIEGTNKSTTTDEYGVYRFSNVETGEYTVAASYVGLKANSVAVSVDSGVSTAGNIILKTNQYLGDNEDVFELEAFEVGGSDYNSNAIAQNERKMSASSKLVQDAEALGEIAEGNIGEFLKNLPGVAIDYTAADPRSIKLRGMSSEFTQVTVDGAQMASAASSGKGRNFELEQVSLSNVDFLEVTKLRRADMPANALGGSVNLVSKNAFAQGGRTIRYKTYFNFNSTEGFDLGETPGWLSDQSRRKTVPGFEVSYSDILIEDKLGATFTFSQSNMFNPQKRAQRNGTWRLNDDGTVANDRVTVQDGPKFTFRQSLAANFDFKLSDSTILTLRSQGNEYDSEFGNRNYSYRIKNYNFAESTDGHAVGDADNGSNAGGSNRHKFGTTYHIDLGAKHTFGNWKLDYGTWQSEATNHYRSFENGHADGASFKNFVLNSGATKMALDSDSNMSPLVNVTAWDADGNVVPNGGVNLKDGQISEIKDRPSDSVDTVTGLRLNAQYNFDLGENQGTVKFGILQKTQNRETNNNELKYRPNAGSDAEVQPIDILLDEAYVGISPGFGYPARDYASFRKALTYLNTHRDQFTYILDDDIKKARGAYLRMEESITAYYLMGQYGFNERKGLFTAGVRSEVTDLSGLIPIDGNLGLDSAGILTGDFAEATNNYTTTHPSAHLRYNFTDKFTLRAGYADTIGRPNFSNMFGPATLSTPNDDGEGNYKITLSNPTLRPRRSDNIDVTAEYYFGDTSLLSLAVFRNKIKDYQGTKEVPMTAELVEALGFTDQIEYRDGNDYTEFDLIKAKFNAGDAQVQGLELSYNQSLDLDFVPKILRGSSFYWNATFLDLEGNFDGTDYAKYSDNLPGFAKRTISYGYVFDHGPASLRFRWNIRGKELNGTTKIDNVEYYNFLSERPTLDINGEYKVNDHATLYFSARNVENVKHERHIEYGDKLLLVQAEDFGVQWSVGVKGKF